MKIKYGLRIPKWAKGPLFKLWLLWIKYRRGEYIAKVMSMRPFFYDPMNTYEDVEK